MASRSWNVGTGSVAVILAKNAWAAAFGQKRPLLQASTRSSHQSKTGSD
jgi:hypothetical protein